MNCLEFFGHVGNRLDMKAKINFEIYDATDCEANNYNTHIAKYLPDNEIWSVNRM